MRYSKPLVIVSILVGLLAAVQSGLGLFMQAGGPGPFSFTSLHGQVVEMFGRGVYAYDTAFIAPIFRGTDALILFVVIPFLALGIVLYRRGSLRGGLLLVGTLAFILYNAASISLGVAYNNLFLIYVAYFSASLFAFILAFSAFNLDELAGRVSQRAPRRGIAVLMFVSALGLLFAWMPDILVPLANGGVPNIASYTTEVTYVFDLGIIVPVSIMAGVFILRRAPLGYLMAATLMVVLVLVGAMVTFQTVFQMLAGIEMTAVEFAAKAGSFMLLSLFSVWLLVKFFGCIRASASASRKTAPRSGIAEK